MPQGYYIVRLFDVATGATLSHDFEGKGVLETCELHLPFWFAPHYHRHLDGPSGIRVINGKYGKEAYPLMAKMIDAVPPVQNTQPWLVFVESKMDEVIEFLTDFMTDEDRDRTKGTINWDDPANTHLLAEAKKRDLLFDAGAEFRPLPSNASYWLLPLIGMASTHPEGVFEVV